MLARLNLWLRFLVSCSSFMLEKSCLLFLLAVPMYCWGIGATLTVYIYSDRENCTLKSPPTTSESLDSRWMCLASSFIVLLTKSSTDEEIPKKLFRPEYESVRDGKINCFPSKQGSSTAGKVAFYSKYSILLALKVYVLYQRKQWIHIVLWGTEECIMATWTLGKF